MPSKDAAALREAAQATRAVAQESRARGGDPSAGGRVVDPQEPVDPREALRAEVTALEAEAAAEDDVDPGLLTWLKACKAVLLAEGFRREIKQARKPGQVWGVIRQEPDDMQIHVRAFKDGRLESEVELSNRYVQHLWSHRRSAHPEVMDILSAHGLPTERVSESFVPITGSKPGKTMPRGRTRNGHVVLAIAGILALLVLRRLAKARKESVTGLRRVVALVRR